MKKASVHRQMFKVREVSDRVKGSPPASVASQLSSRTCLGNITLEVVKTLGMARSGIKVLKAIERTRRQNDLRAALFDHRRRRPSTT